MRADRLCKLSAARGEVRRDNWVSVLQLERSYHRETNRAAADHQRYVFCIQASLLHRVISHRHRLSQRGSFGGEAIWHFEQQSLSQAHVLAITARVVVRIPDRL